jgi:hypothetical protein
MGMLHPGSRRSPRTASSELCCTMYSVYSVYKKDRARSAWLGIRKDQQILQFQYSCTVEEYSFVSHSYNTAAQWPSTSGLSLHCEPD